MQVRSHIKRFFVSPVEDEDLGLQMSYGAKTDNDLQEWVK